MYKEIYVIDDDDKLIKYLVEMFKKENPFTFKSVKTYQVEDVLKSIPDLIIINEDSINNDICDLCEKIRQNEDNSITPIIVISSNSDKKHILEVMSKQVEYYIGNQFDEDILYHIIMNITRLLYVNRRVSPLTGLPGNVQIQTEMKKRLLKKKEFAVLYLDLDNFKAYNDVYGFLKGDEVIKLTAKVISRNVHRYKSGDVFVGHIGGDDFVAIVDESTKYEEVCQNIVAEFDIEVLKHFNNEDVEKGYLEVKNRRGIIEEFPLTSISIGVVVVDGERFDNILEIGEVGAQIKHLAKTTMGSSYAIDRRRNKS